VLQSTFTSVRAMALRRGLPGFLVRDDFDSQAALEKLRLPLLVAHGRRDGLIPVEHGEALARAGRGAFLTYDCDHNDFPPAWADWVAEVMKAISR
jgi:fermentation-respiration switch protein FrsA (DUF1100 family)